MRMRSPLLSFTLLLGLMAGRCDVFAATGQEEDLLARSHIRGGEVGLRRNTSPELEALADFERGLREEQAHAITLALDLNHLHFGTDFGTDLPAQHSLTQWLAVPNPNAPKPAQEALFSERFLRFVDFYQNHSRGREIFASWLKKQGRYKEMILRILKEHNLPDWILYVAMIESGYDPHDLSGKGAVGLWQFMPEGARIYGLRVDTWVDERRDPVKSTEAVARYLGDLKARFGDWKLALAAFNAGYGAVSRMMAKHNTTDYWTLSQVEGGLPDETRDYVPKVMATALVGSNLPYFRFDKVSSDPALSLVRCTLPAKNLPPMQLAQVAQVLRDHGQTISDQELARLNPHLNKGWLVSGKINNEQTTPTLYIPNPAGSVHPFEKDKLFAWLKAEISAPKTHVARFGETWESLADKTGFQAAVLRKYNGFGKDQFLRRGDTLFLPTTEPSQDAKEAKKAESTLIVIGSVPGKNPEGKKRAFYKVTSGDTLSEIAVFFGVGLKDLLRWNALDPKAILPKGLIVDLWLDPHFDTSQVVLVDPKRIVVAQRNSDSYADAVETVVEGRKRIAHLCNGKETLAQLSEKYRLSVASIQRINPSLGGLSPQKTDQPLATGTRLYIYQPMTAEEKESRLAALQKRTWGILQHPDQEKQVAVTTDSPAPPIADQPTAAAEPATEAAQATSTAETVPVALVTPTTVTPASS